MATTIDITCPNCGKTSKGPSDIRGKRIKCKQCETVFQVPAAPVVKVVAKPVMVPTVVPATVPVFLDETESDEADEAEARRDWTQALNRWNTARRSLSRGTSLQNG